jgi:hypothetical protein
MGAMLPMKTGPLTPVERFRVNRTSGVGASDIRSTALAVHLDRAFLGLISIVRNGIKTSVLLR